MTSNNEFQALLDDLQLEAEFAEAALLEDKINYRFSWERSNPLKAVHA